MKIGLVIPLCEYPRHQPSYLEIRALALHAEEAAFDSLWAFDHLLMRESPLAAVEGSWECLTILTALAEATSTVMLGSLVLCTAFRSPAVVAKMATTLDEVSAGRFVLGLGSGWHDPEFEACGFTLDHRVSRFEESLHVVTGLLRNTAFGFDGKYHRAVHGEIRPRGPRPGGPPILVGGSGPRMLRLAAENADFWNCCWFSSAADAEPAVEQFRAVCRETGRDPGSIGITLGVNVDVIGGDHVQPYGPTAAPVLSGSAVEVAKGISEFADLGVGQVILNLNPHDADAQRRLAEAVAEYRQNWSP